VRFVGWNPGRGASLCGLTVPATAWKPTRR